MSTYTIDRLDGANNVLLLGSSRHERTDETCSDLLAVREASQLNVLNVTTSQTPADRLDFWSTHVDEELPANATILRMGDVEDRQSEKERCLTSTVDIRPIADPSDTLTLGLEMTQHLSKWATNDNQSVGCVYTLSDLLRRAGRGPTIELLTRMLDRNIQIDAHVHYHLNPDAVDEDTLQLLKPLFDAVVEVSSENDLRVERFNSGEGNDSGEAHNSGEAHDSVEAHHPEEAARFDERRITFETDHILKLLADQRCRELLYKLERQKPGEPIDFGELVDHILDIESDGRGTDRRDLRRRVAIDLQHQHLPKLEEARVIQYDSDTKIVRYPWNSAFTIWLKHIQRVDNLLVE